MLSLAEVERFLAGSRWTPASSWERRGAPDDGHPHDFVLRLEHRDFNLRAEVVITSYDLDGRTEDGLALWTRQKIRDEAATALRAFDFEKGNHDP